MEATMKDCLVPQGVSCSLHMDIPIPTLISSARAPAWRGWGGPGGLRDLTPLSDPQYLIQKKEPPLPVQGNSEAEEPPESQAAAPPQGGPLRASVSLLE